MYKLFPLFLVGGCGGASTTLGSLHKITAATILGSKSFNKEGPEFSVAELICNKLTPENLNFDKLAEIDVCENHKSNMSDNHKSLRQVNCGVKDCKSKTAEDRKRVTVEVSSAAFQNFGFHIIVGSPLCTIHRKTLKHSSTDANTTDKSKVCNSVVDVVRAVPQTATQRINVLPATQRINVVPATQRIDMVSATERINLVPCSSKDLTSLSRDSPDLVNQIVSQFPSHETKVDNPSDKSADLNQQVLPVNCQHEDYLGFQLPPMGPLVPAVSQSYDLSQIEANQDNVQQSRLKRKMLTEAQDKPPKFAKQSSTISSESSTPSKSQQLSQGSTFSTSSDVEALRRLDNFSIMMSCLDSLDPELASSIVAPFDLLVKDRTLKRYLE